MSDVFNWCEIESADEHEAHQIQDRNPGMSDQDALKAARRRREDRQWTEVWVD
jgi:hypothetical protein